MTWALMMLLGGGEARAQVVPEGTVLVEVPQADGGVARCGGSVLHPSVILTSGRCLDDAMFAASDDAAVRVLSGSQRGVLRRVVETARPYADDYALVIVRWTSPPPASVRLGRSLALADEGFWSPTATGDVVWAPAGPDGASAGPWRGGAPLAGAGVFDAVSALVGLVSASGDVVWIRDVVPASPRLTSAAQGRAPLRFPEDGGWL